MTSLRVFRLHARRGRARIASLTLALAVLATSGLAGPAFAVQDTVDRDVDRLRAGLSEEEDEALTTLALADESLRDAILDASLHPNALASLAAIQERSSTAFRKRLEGESRGTQQDVWELSRYPELIDAIVLGGRPTRGAIDHLVEGYPERIQEIARGLALHHFSLVSDIATIREEAERENRITLTTLPLSTQASFEALIERPDLLSAMLREPEVTERIANLVRDDAWNARTILDREHELASARRERELDEWRDTIENDPEAERELRDSAERFAEDEGYDDPDYYAERRTEVHHYYHHPYPWWFGPPHWRVGWHWYPHHTHWGFHVSLGGGLVIHSLPSPVFSYWHYRRPHRHHHHYRHLHRHWSRYGSRHHLHRDYKHRFHHKKRHKYHHRKRHSTRGGYYGHHDVRGDRRDRHHTRYERRHRYDERKVNKFFRHGTKRKYDSHEVRRSDRKRRGSNQKWVRDGTKRDRKRTSAKQRDSRRSRDKASKKKLARWSPKKEKKYNHLTTSKRKSSKKTSKKARPSNDRKSKKFTKSKKRGSKKKSSRFSKKTRSKKSAKAYNKKTSSKKRKSSKKSGKNKSKRSTNKFFARR